MSRSRAATHAGKRRASGSAPRSRAAHSSSRRPPRKPPQKRKPARTRRPAPPRKAARPRGGLSWRGRLLLAAALLGALAGGYLLWFRDSSLVAVTDVEVAGSTTSQRGAITGELTALSEEMTTLHFDSERIERAALAFSTVESVDVDPNFPHGVRIEIDERPPRLIAEIGGAKLPVAADGTVLEGVEADEGTLPSLELDEAPAGPRLEGAALEQALVAGAAPGELRPLIEKLGSSDRYGIEVDLAGGVELRFGDAERIEEKWLAAAAVLANSDRSALTYVDVRIPERAASDGAGSEPAVTPADPQA